MNKEIKFRVYDKKKKTYFCPKDLGAWFIRQDGILEHQLASMGGTGLDGKMCYCSTNSPKVKDYFIIEQFTGFKDSEGKEIYEGDILFSDCFGKTTVLFEYGCFVESKYRYTLSFLAGVDYKKYILKNYKIIGNIHKKYKEFD